MRLSALLLMIASFSLKAQDKSIFQVRNESGKGTLPGTTVQVKKYKITTKANDSGIVILKGIPPGKQELEFTHTGFKDVERDYVFPLSSNDTIQVFMISELQELQDVIISSTRANRSITTTPTRVEVIAAEEIHEEGEMRPGDIRMLLSESTGIQAQQTSATSASAGIRIQGLDGRYTQVLKDGFPIYAGAATGLGILQTPPLDLQQVEIIKGAASTLYGGGAIAGLINLVSKVPGLKKELNFHINATSAGGFDANSFYSQRFHKAGVTVFGAVNTNKAYDPAGIMFSAIPKFERYTFTPKLFLYFNDKTKLSFGFNTVFENRLGGDMNYIRGKGDSTHSYFEFNKTKRFSTQLNADHQLSSNSSINIKNSIGYFNRIINSRGYEFEGTQYSSFTEASYATKGKGSDWVMGINVLTDHFTEKQLTTTPSRNYDQNTLSTFVQNTWNASEWLILETGLRVDHVNDYGFAFTPRISALLKIAPNLTSRIGGGGGYKPPTIFSEESERLLFRNVLPINASLNKLERSYGVNGDISYPTSFDKLSISFNQFIFYTYIKDPLELDTLGGGIYRFENSSGHTDTRGAETNIRIGYDDISLYLGYTYTDARLYNKGINKQNPLTPKHRFNSALVYEIENKWKFGSELYYFSPQELTSGLNSRSYWLYGFVAERLWKHISLYINFENIGDVRQTKFEGIYTGTITNPVFKDIYAPLEGFVWNGGIRVKM